MDVRTIVILLGTLFVHVNVVAQFSGYVSATYGYHENPLYNYERVFDNIKQSYLELNYDKEFEASNLHFGYTSGLMLFDRFQDRNYYEHNILSSYNMRFEKRSADLNGGEVDKFARDDSIGHIDAGGQSPKVTALDDSTDAYLDLAFTGSARHDKSVYKEFDNYGTELAATYRFMISKRFFLRISNAVGYRSYTYLSELSNVHDILAFGLGNKTGTSFDFGLRVIGGVKHYTSSVYDTARFETRRTYSETATGKGKGGAKLVVPSTKKILTSPGSNNAFQLSPGFYLVKKWSRASIGAEFLYRLNFGTSTRYLAQYANTSILTEDIYNDHFSYEGPEIQTTYKRTTWFGIQSMITVALQRKNFGAPAFDLAGDQIGNHRKDLRSSAEAYISKYFKLFEGSGLDISVGAGAVRNQSSDDYNDYSALNISMSVGIDF